MQQNGSLSLSALLRVPVSHAFQPSTMYRGSQKHKNRPTEERKGTLCPEWTHATTAGGYRYDPFGHRWDETEAHRLFQRSVLDANGRRRYATARGIAFEAKPTEDGTWHGYPVPWETVPSDITNKWIDDGEVTRRQIKKFWKKDEDDLRWAIDAGTP
jgi:hypothetical protein